MRQFFWDYEGGQPTGPGRDGTVMARLLQQGGLAASRWLRDTYGDDALRHFIVKRRGRGLSPKRLRFWGLVLGLPRGQVDAWVAASRAQPWHTRVR